MELISTHTILTSDLGIRGNLFGGKFLTWLDLAAYSLAVQKVKNPNLVSIKISECLFIRPAKISNLIKIYGKVKSIGKTSITIIVEARRYDVINQDESLICTTEIVLVQVDEYGKPSEIIA
jgi:acyl-CoA thioesterase YciA